MIPASLLGGRLSIELFIAKLVLLNPPLFAKLELPPLLELLLPLSLFPKLFLPFETIELLEFLVELLEFIVELLE